MEIGPAAFAAMCAQFSCGVEPARFAFTHFFFGPRGLAGMSWVVRIFWEGWVWGENNLRGEESWLVVVVLMVKVERSFKRMCGWAGMP